jgi:hypothetical protein
MCAAAALRSARSLDEQWRRSAARPISSVAQNRNARVASRMATIDDTRMVLNTPLRKIGSYPYNL